MKIRSYVMVASVDCKEDASRDSTDRLAEWTQVTGRQFITGRQAWKPKKKGISNSRVSEQAMRVFIETMAKTNDSSKQEANVPHKPRKVEAFKKKAPVLRKKVIKDLTSKSFPNSKFQKNFDLGVAEMKEYESYHKGSTIFESTRKLKKDYISTLQHLENQLKVYKLVLKFKISRIPKYFCPYAELHFKRAAQNFLPASVRDNPKHMFHHYHRLGIQQWYVNRYKVVLTSLLQNLDFHMDTLKTEHRRYEDSSEYFYDLLYNEPDTYFKHEKIQKNVKKTKKPEKLFF
jgi:hypothetical protein